MNKRGRFSISTSVFNKAYLRCAWSERNRLAPYERHGFAQFFYLTISGQLEAVISAMIKARLASIRYMFHWDRLPPMTYTCNGEENSCSVEPLASSLLALLDATSAEAERAPYEQLCGLFSQIFSKTVSEIIGKERDQDMKALFRLRNIFAHSREFYLEHEGLDSDHKITLEGNPLFLPAQRLQRAGIIKHFDFTGKNHPELQAYFYSEQALLHFYDQVVEAETQLRNSVEFPLERGRLFLEKLPDLRDEENELPLSEIPSK